MTAVWETVLHRHRDVVPVEHLRLVQCELVRALATGAASAGLVVVHHGLEMAVARVGLVTAARVGLEAVEATGFF
jgi:hypothetical protein